MSLRTMSVLSVMLVVVFAYLPTSSAQEVRTDQEIVGDRLIDYGYLFEIDGSGNDWQLLPEDQVRMVIPDAIGGVLHTTTNIYLAVIAEEAPGLDVGTAATLLMEAMPLENSSVELYEATTFLGLPAVRFVISGLINGLTARYGTVVVNRMGTLYQIICFGLTDTTTADGLAFAPAFARFSFREGDHIPRRLSGRSVPDTLGVGWEIVAGNYRNAAYGIVVEPSEPGWRVSVGMELERGTADAEFGLTHEGPEIYVSVVPERVSGVDHTSFAEGLTATFQRDMALGAPSGTLNVSFGDVPVELSIYPSTTAYQPMDIAYGIAFREDIAYQVIVNWLAGQSEAVIPQLGPGLSQVRFLEAAERAALATELRSLRDPQNVVGIDFVVRNGVFVDYLNDFVWEKPDEGYWRIIVDQEARLYNQLARFVVIEPALGLMGLAIIEDIGAMDATLYHNLVMAAIAPAGHEVLSTAPIIRPTASGELRANWLDMEHEGLAIRYLVTSTTHNGKGIQLLLWGYPGNVEASESALWQAVDALHLSATPILQVRRGSANNYQDHRLGFQIEATGTGWSIEDATPPELAPIASLVLAGPDEDNGVVVLALCAYAEGQDERWFEQIVEQQMLQYFRDEMGVTTMPAIESTLAGMPSRLITGYSLNGSMLVALHMLQRDHTFYGIIGFTNDPTGTQLQTYLQSFTWVD